MYHAIIFYDGLTTEIQRVHSIKIAGEHHATITIEEFIKNPSNTFGFLAIFGDNNVYSFGNTQPISVQFIKMND